MAEPHFYICVWAMRIYEFFLAYFYPDEKVISENNVLREHDDGVCYQCIIVIACGVVKSITSDRQAHQRAAIFARRASRPENDIAVPLTQRVAIECRR